MNQLFKTISFPKENSGTNRTEKIHLAFNKSTDISIFNEVKDLRSSDIRALLPKSSFKELTEAANKERRSLNQLCLLLLSKKADEIKKSYGNNTSMAKALSRDLVYTNIDRKSATWHDNKIAKIHRWYPYVEGFSCSFVEQIIDNLTYKPTLIYDPFGGAGTTQIVASHKNIPSKYSEINPFMRFVIECKINHVLEFTSNFKTNNRKMCEFIDKLEKSTKKRNDVYSLYGQYIAKLGTDKYFDKRTLENILRIKLIVQSEFNRNTLLKNLSLFALSTIIVSVSNTIRRADLRYRKESEKKHSSKDVFPLYITKLKEMVEDISEIKDFSLCRTKCVSEDAKNIPASHGDKFNLVITSPPYVNGTNYFRNSKLELHLLDLVANSSEIGELRKRAVTSGINNVVMSKPNEDIKIKNLSPIINELTKKAYDKRIPILVESYFKDMHKVFANTVQHMSSESSFYLDIGDSQFANVHIPTDKILTDIAEENNLELIDNKFIRERFSKNGMALKQVLLLFKKNKFAKPIYINKNIKKKGARGLLEKNVDFFRAELPYKESPYSSRNWGHGLHNLCSYQGKLKPALAHFLVKCFSSESMRVLDPLCGIGTVPLEACLQGRVGIGNDISLMAYVNTLAKTNRPDYTGTHKELEALKEYIRKNLVKERDVVKIKFGFNKDIKEYYHIRTFQEIVTAREYFRKIKKYDAEKALLLSSVLHILHGNRPYALSRRSHNVIPVAPRGPFQYKSLVDKACEKINRTLSLEYPDSFKKGRSCNVDYAKLGNHINRNSIDAIITSPPFFGSTRFYMSNWLRMWFCGWDKEDFSIQKDHYLEAQQIKDMYVYDKFFTVCKSLLNRNGVLIMHLGKSEKHDMGKTLSDVAGKHFKTFALFSENVTHCEKFGIKDQGATKAHQFLFLV